MMVSKKKKTFMKKNSGLIHEVPVGVFRKPLSGLAKSDVTTQVKQPGSAGEQEG